jgi:hypothetical protein
MQSTIVTAIGLTAAELALGPRAEWLTNPERFEFYDIAVPATRYRIVTGAFSAAAAGATAWGGITGTLSAQADLNLAITTQTTNAQTGTTYTLVAADAGANVDMNNASANTLTIPLNAAVAFSIGTTISVTQAGAGATTIAFAGTVQKPASRTLVISAQYESAVLTKMAADTWRIVCN